MTERYESRASTHADDCWSWGPGHYKCAVRKIERLRTENEQLREALEPFADVAEYDIGGDEADTDLFRPIDRKNAVANPITVGDMRKALSALAQETRKRGVEHGRRELQAMSDTTDEIVRAAVHWWESHRPLSFTLHEHLEHCTVNTNSDSAKKLAHAVANAVRISLDAKSSHRNDLVNVPEGE